MTAGLDIYQLYINGKLVSREVLKPGFTHPFKTKRSFTYDITRAIKRGAGDVNTLSVQVTPGWWADKIVTPGGTGTLRPEKPSGRGRGQSRHDTSSAPELP